MEEGIGFVLDTLKCLCTEFMHFTTRISWWLVPAKGTNVRIPNPEMGTKFEGKL